MLIFAAKNCGQLPAPANGRKSFQDKTTFGGTVRLRCNGHLGYELKGSQQRTCEGNGQWSGVTTTCQCTYKDNFFERSTS